MVNALLAGLAEVAQVAVALAVGTQPPRHLVDEEVLLALGEELSLALGSSGSLEIAACGTYIAPKGPSVSRARMNLICPGSLASSSAAFGRTGSSPELAARPSTELREAEGLFSQEDVPLLSWAQCCSLQLRLLTGVAALDLFSY
eukprot:CAMPEP_0170510850 /NCGR_PEP_ID=MMETSP0208-20121228/65986_1 /TAXON_ID=197538 /ORGANISM="Strombidium inclinatum, Strain S3" /LENGTH=144 /DNA_ID=CAMNT_0010794341 /DNA_START=4378 /DNA_END=4811 /DNA_ORIENTATION=+